MGEDSKKTPAVKEEETCKKAFKKTIAQAQKTQMKDAGP